MCNRYVPDDNRGPGLATRLHPGTNFPPDKIGAFQDGPFIRVGTDGNLEQVIGQWGMIRPGAPTRREKARDGRLLMTNNARSESLASKPTFRDAWSRGQRCIIPAWSYDEPNWETGKNIWWSLRRATDDEGSAGSWAIGGLWSEWLDKDTGEVVPNYTMITVNVDRHPLLGRLHKPDPKLPADQQDKRGLVLLEPEELEPWLYGDGSEAWRIIHSRMLPSVFDASDAQRTDEMLRATAQTPEQAPAQAPLI